ncbi:hypothetical protein ACOTEQ_14155 [Achromobacter xylosoxidans]
MIDVPPRSSRNLPFNQALCSAIAVGGVEALRYWFDPFAARDGAGLVLACAAIPAKVVLAMLMVWGASHRWLSARGYPRAGWYVVPVCLIIQMLAVMNQAMADAVVSQAMSPLSLVRDASSMVALPVELVMRRALSLALMMLLSWSGARMALALCIRHAEVKVPHSPWRPDAAQSVAVAASTLYVWKVLIDDVFFNKVLSVGQSFAVVFLDTLIEPIIVSAIAAVALRKFVWPRSRPQGSLRAAAFGTMIYWFTQSLIVLIWWAAFLIPPSSRLKPAALLAYHSLVVAVSFPTLMVLIMVVIGRRLYAYGPVRAT